MPLSAGDRLGPYEILAPIGAGGMGQVWKARDPRLDRIVAIKISREQFSERFELEARAVAALNHPHICQLYDVGPDYLVMEFVDGAPLKGPLPIEKSVEYAAQILDALDAAHQKGITHRDLKPDNILVTKQGIKLLDFGLAKRQGTALKETDATLTHAMTQQGQILGTFQYMSPEQLQGKEVDPRSDLFSFGCVVYEMLTGKRAFEGQSTASDPFWSPDSRWIGFISDGMLKKIPAGGGPVQVLAASGNSRGAAWGADDTILFVSGNTGLFRVSSSGGPVTAVTTLDASRQEVGHRWPRFLPDGRHFLYLVRSGTPENRGIYASSLNGNTRKLILSTDSSVTYAPPGYCCTWTATCCLGSRSTRAGLSSAVSHLPLRSGWATQA
jgi:serine/threonine protein kinase